MTARLAAFVLLAWLSGCQDARPVAPNDPYAEFVREIVGNVGINQEYEIQASFPVGKIVCVSDAMTHLHGFHQYLEGDCRSDEPAKRAISIWADYNSGEETPESIQKLYCGETSLPQPMKVTVSPARGWTTSCGKVRSSGQYEVTVAYLSAPQERNSGKESYQVGYIYSATLVTDSAHREKDLAAFATFVAKLRLAGTSLIVKSHTGSD